MMENVKDILLANCLPSSREQVEAMFATLPTKVEIGIVCKASLEHAAKEAFAELLKGCPFQSATWITLLHDDVLDDIPAVGRSAFFLLVMDALQPLTESEIMLFDYLVSHSAVRNNAAIVLLHADKVASILEIARSVRQVLEVKGLSLPVFSSSVDLSRQVTEMIEKTSIDLDAVRKEYVHTIKTRVVVQLEKAFSVVQAELADCDARMDKLMSNKDSFKVFAESVKVDLWCQARTYCDKHFNNDITDFAKQALSWLDKQLDETDMDEITYYFSGYVNYLWKQFLSYEVQEAIRSIRVDLNESLQDLAWKFKKYFGVEMEQTGLTGSFIQPGEQPISSTIDIDRPINKVIEGIVRFMVDFLLVYTSPWLILLGDHVSDLLIKLLRPFRFKYSGDDLRRVYKDAVYNQFYTGLPEIRQQLEDVLMPSLQSSFKESLDEVFQAYDMRIETFRKMLEQQCASLLSKKHQLEKNIETIKNI